MQQLNPEQAVSVQPSQTSVTPPSITSDINGSQDTSSQLSPSGQSVLQKLQGKSGIEGNLSSTGNDVLKKLQARQQNVVGVESSVSGTKPDSPQGQVASVFNKAIESATSSIPLVGTIASLVQARGEGIGQDILGLAEGINHGVGSVAGGLAHVAAIASGSQKWIQGVEDYMGQKEAEFQQVKKINPVTTTIGDAVGKLGALIPALALAPEGLAANGAVLGATGSALQYSKDDKSLIDIGKKAVTGGLVGAITGGTLELTGMALSSLVTSRAAQFLQNAWKGLPFLNHSPDDIVNQAIKTSGAGENAGATLESANNAFNTLRMQMRETKNSLYAARDKVADSLNINVKFDNLSGSLSPKALLIDENGVERLIDPQAKAFAQKILKNAPDTVNFSIGQQIVSQLGGKANDLAISGQPALAQSYTLLKNAALKDMDKSASGVDKNIDSDLVNLVVKNHNTNGGSTIHPQLGDLGGTNQFAVAGSYPNLSRVVDFEELSTNDVNRYLSNPDVKKALDSNSSLSIRTWAHDGKTDIELTHTTDNVKDAVSLGQKNNQISILNLKNFKEIPTGGTGTRSTVQNINNNPYTVLQQAQSVANSFYKNSYAPLKDIAVANAITDKYVNTNLVSNLLKGVGTGSETASKAWAILPQDTQQQFSMAYVNALREAKTNAADKFNLSAFSNSLKQATDKIPQLTQVGINMDSIVKIAAAAGQAQSKTMPSFLGMSGTVAGAAALVTGHPAIAAGIGSAIIVTKLPMLAAAGKILNSVQTAPIIDAIGNSTNIAGPIMKNLLIKGASALTAMLYTSQREQKEVIKSISLGVRD